MSDPWKLSRRLAVAPTVKTKQVRGMQCGFERGAYVATGRQRRSGRPDGLDRRCPSASIDGGFGGSRLNNRESENKRKRRIIVIVTNKTTGSKAVLAGGRAGSSSQDGGPAWMACGKKAQRRRNGNWRDETMAGRSSGAEVAVWYVQVGRVVEGT